MRRLRTRSVAVAAAAGAGACVLATATAAETPSDPDATHPAYAALNLPAAWDLTSGSPEVVGAIVDSGVDAAHPELAGAVLPGYDFVDDDTDASPVDFHGTGVAGTAAARANNGIGGVGACFRCSVMPLLLSRPIVSGRPRVGVRLVAKHGRCTGENLRFTVRWQRCKSGACERVATGRSYLLGAADRGHRLRVLVQASNSLGFGAALSTPTRIVS